MGFEVSSQGDHFCHQISFLIAEICKLVLEEKGQFTIRNSAEYFMCRGSCSDKRQCRFHLVFMEGMTL